MSHPKVTIIIPVLNDAKALSILLPQLQQYREAGHEVLVVDGGSNDGSMTTARGAADRVLITGVGRSRQMNLGADNARHEILLFLHADSILPAEALKAIQTALSVPDRTWGRFDVRLDQDGLVYRVIGNMMNLRSRLSGIATGDQGLFVLKDTFHRAGGFPDIPLMEDIAVSKRLLKTGRPACLSAKLVTSARRWQQQGVFKTILLMWYLRLGYFLGRSPEALAKIYYPSTTAQND